MIQVDTDVIAIRKIERHTAYGSSGPQGNEISIVRLPVMIRFRRRWYLLPAGCVFAGDVPHKTFNDLEFVEGWQCFECMRYFFATSTDGLNHECTEA